MLALVLVSRDDDSCIWSSFLQKTGFVADCAHSWRIVPDTGCIIHHVLTPGMRHHDVLAMTVNIVCKQISIVAARCGYTDAPSRSSQATVESLLALQGL